MREIKDLTPYSTQLHQLVVAQVVVMLLMSDPLVEQAVATVVATVQVQQVHPIKVLMVVAVIHLHLTVQGVAVAVHRPMARLEHQMVAVMVVLD